MSRSIKFQEEALVKLVSGKERQNVITRLIGRISSTYNVLFPKKSATITKRFQVRTVRPDVILTHKAWSEELSVSKLYEHGENTGKRVYI